jgi:hypothetical protein
MDISRVEFFCKDGKVGEVLRLLAGIALEVPKVTPVVNAKKGKNGLEEQTSGKASDMFVVHQTKQGPEFGTDELRNFLETIGRSVKSTNTVIGHLLEEKKAKRVGRGRFRITARR